MKTKSVLEILVLASLALAAGCSTSSNPYFAPNLLSNISPTSTPTHPVSTPSSPTRTFTPAFTPTHTATPCPYLGNSGSPTGGGAVVSGASGSTTSNSYFSENFTATTSFTVQSFQAVLSNSGTSPETFFAAVYDSSNNLVSGSPATLVVQAGGGNYNYAWQTFDYASGVAIASGNYTFVGYITTGTNVSLGTINTTGSCQGTGGLLSGLSSFPGSIGGVGAAGSFSCFGWLLSTCP